MLGAGLASLPPWLGWRGRYWEKYASNSSSGAEPLIMVSKLRQRGDDTIHYSWRPLRLIVSSQTRLVAADGMIKTLVLLPQPIWFGGCSHLVVATNNQPQLQLNYENTSVKVVINYWMYTALFYTSTSMLFIDFQPCQNFKMTQGT